MARRRSALLGCRSADRYQRAHGMGRSAAPLEVAGMDYWALLWADPEAMSNSANRSSLPATSYARAMESLMI